ncbi:hypothetical protein [Luteolibacter sp. Populi]|uniref:hypothetical protein n=1 Tax=Luteolibacter sp. Populi TaxID=3230487 RepID=UPI003467A5AD
MPAKGGAASGKDPADPKLTLVKPGPLPKSTDTVESLLQLERGPLYARLGLWLLDASEEEMTAFWEGYYQREDPNDTIKDLLFTQWGKKNAAGMLEMARRTGCEIPAMWSWSMSDPQGMLAYIEGKPERMRNFGLRGLAYFHPELARQMLEQDPKLLNTFEMEQLAERLSGGDPKAEMEFMTKYRNDEYYARQGLKKWAAQDPHRAFEWLTEHPGEEYTRKEFFDTVKKEHPDVLPELAATLPSGAMRREIEAAAFAHLAETDPEKAAEEARKIGVPRLAAERLSLLGQSLAAEDPARAFEILGEIFEKCPDAANRPAWVRYPDGSGGGSNGVTGVSRFLAALAAHDPRQTMQAVLDLEMQDTSPSAPTPYHSYPASRQVAGYWAQGDLEGFSAWCESQHEPGLRDMGASMIVDQFQRQNDFTSAAGWVARISDANRQQNALSNLVSGWASQDREAARRWVDQAEISDQARESLSPYFPETQE